MRTVFRINSIGLLLVVGTIATAQPAARSTEKSTTVDQLESGEPRPAVAAKPYLTVTYRLVESGSDRLAASLESGGRYDVLISLQADQQTGVKINPLFRTQELRLDLIDDRVKFADEPRTRQERRKPKSRTVRLDLKSGSAKFTIAPVEAMKLAAKDAQLKLIADLMVCDNEDTFCVKTREEALLTLPEGSHAMKPLPLGFNSEDKTRRILVPRLCLGTQ